MDFSQLISPPPPPPPPLPSTRRVFFSFHFQNDIWRANQVRQSWRFNKTRLQSCRYSNDDLGFRDASIWEKAKGEGVSSMKRLIHTRLKNTSVTCILAGSETYSRRWVRYEIAKSVARGNALLVVYINELKIPNGSTSRAGPNPLNHIGVYMDSSNNWIHFAERESVSKGWKHYEDHRSRVTLWKGWTRPLSTSPAPLTSCVRTYSYISDNGKDNFVNWVHRAANSLK